MSRPIARRSTLLLAAAAALMVAAFAAVPAAQASTLYACVTKSGSAHLYTKKPKKCKSKKEKLVSWNNVGPAGKNGANGGNGANGTNGSNGANGAVAGYVATQSSSLDITNAEALTQVPGLTKTLPAGSYIVTGSIHASGIGSKAGEYVSAECSVIDTPTKGSATEHGGVWASSLAPIFIFEVTETMIPLNLAVTTATTSTLAVKCREAGRGEKVEETVESGNLLAIQTSSNS